MTQTLGPTRARDLGIAIGTGTPGTANAITDVEGIRVGPRVCVTARSSISIISWTTLQRILDALSRATYRRDELLTVAQCRFIGRTIKVACASRIARNEPSRGGSGRTPSARSNTRGPAATVPPALRWRRPKVHRCVSAGHVAARNRRGFLRLTEPRGGPASPRENFPVNVPPQRAGCGWRLSGS